MEGGPEFDPPPVPYNNRGVHGTYLRRWQKNTKRYVDVWPAIKREGLKPMGRRTSRGADTSFQWLR